MPYTKFEFDISISGARVIVGGLPMMTASHGGEIDNHIKRLKDELDVVAVKMKAADVVQSLKPDF
jgi:hypothetical protein